MPSLKDLRNRIKSVKNTRQITKTMKMVSAAKVRRARQACEDTRPYANKLQQVVANLGSSGSADHPLLAQRSSVNTVRLIVVGAQRGLCGGLNGNVVKEATQRINELRDTAETIELVLVGRKVCEQLGKIDGITVLAKHTKLEDLSFETACTLIDSAVTDYLSNACDQVELIFPQFENMLKQPPVRSQLLPFSVESSDETSADAVSSSYEFEPDAASLLDDLVPRAVRTVMFRALLETDASEQAARMTAMDNATRNAGDMINRLSLDYNRSRQAAITKELVEIVAGAEAV